jgi:hypothetical protein
VAIPNFARLLSFAERTPLRPIIATQSRGVAQPGSAPASGAGGRRFESSRPDQSITYVIFSRMLHPCVEKTCKSDSSSSSANGNTFKRSHPEQCSGIEINRLASFGSLGCFIYLAFRPRSRKRRRTLQMEHSQGKNPSRQKTFFSQKPRRSNRRISAEHSQIGTALKISGIKRLSQG